MQIAWRDIIRLLSPSFTYVVNESCDALDANHSQALREQLNFEIVTGMWYFSLQTDVCQILKSHLLEIRRLEKQKTPHAVWALSRYYITAATPRDDSVSAWLKQPRTGSGSNRSYSTLFSQTHALNNVP